MRVALRRTIMLLTVLALLGLAVIPVASASVPGPGGGWLIGVVDTDATYCFVNGTYRTLHGGWFSAWLPVGEQTVHLYIPNRGWSSQHVNVPASGWVAVSFGQM